MTVRAKFKVTGTSQREHWDKTKGPIHTIELAPVDPNQSPENKAFYAATPSGSVNLGIINDEAAKTFVLGDEYYIDFTPAQPTPRDQSVGAA